MIIRKEYNGGLKGFLERFKDIGKPKVYIGVPSGGSRKKRRKDKLTIIANKYATNNATILAAHELGAPSRGIPARPVLVPTIQKNSQKYVDLMAQGIKNALANGTDPNVVYEKIGIVASNDVKDYFVSGSFKPLDQKTIDRKGSSKPLVDTGELRSSITYEVRK